MFVHDDLHGDLQFPMKSLFRFVDNFYKMFYSTRTSGPFLNEILHSIVKFLHI